MLENSGNVVAIYPERHKGEGFKGQFKNLKLSDLIQLSTQGRMSLILHINQAGKDGKIYIYEGEIIHASYNKKTGVEAFYEIMTWKNGNFHVDSYIPPPIQSITLPWEHLLIEAHRFMDERKANAHLQQGSKVLQLENLSEKMLERFKSWAASHTDVAEMGIFSSGGIRSIYRREDYPSTTGSIEILHLIPELTQLLGNAFRFGACEEVVITATQGTIIVLCFREDVQLFVLLSSELSKKAILKMELKRFIADTRKKLNPTT